MKKYVIFRNGCFVDVNRIAYVENSEKGSMVYIDVVGGDSDYLEVAESPAEVIALIQGALGTDAEFIQSV